MGAEKNGERKKKTRHRKDAGRATAVAHPADPQPPQSTNQSQTGCVVCIALTTGPRRRWPIAKPTRQTRANQLREKKITANTRSPATRMTARQLHTAHLRNSATDKEQYIRTAAAAAPPHSARETTAHRRVVTVHPLLRHRTRSTACLATAPTKLHLRSCAGSNRAVVRHGQAVV